MLETWRRLSGPSAFGFQALRQFGAPHTSDSQPMTAQSARSELRFSIPDHKWESERQNPHEKPNRKAKQTGEGCPLSPL